jgi:hypothetical protein
MFDQKLAWNWHKGWNLPMIRLHINKKQCLGNLPTAKLKVVLSAIKSVPKGPNEKDIVHIKLEGQTVQYVCKGKATFYGIKFSTTSFKNDGLKFNLIATIIVENKLPKDGSTASQALLSLISPPIFVDSRKASRDSSEIKKNKLITKYFTPFSPALLEKPIELKSKQKGYEKIDNNLDGLCNYLGSSSIKNKIKHPLFLLFRFSSCIRLYYNPKVISEHIKKYTSVEETVIIELQKLLWSMEQNENLGKFKGLNTEVTNIESTHFIMLIEEPAEGQSFYFAKTISENLEKIESDKLHFTFNHSKIPQYFTEMNNKKLESIYVLVFSVLENMKSNEQSLASSPRNESEQDSESQEEIRQPKKSKISKVSEKREQKSMARAPSAISNDMSNLSFQLSDALSVPTTQLQKSSKRVSIEPLSSFSDAIAMPVTQFQDPSKRMSLERPTTPSDQEEKMSFSSNTDSIQNIKKEMESGTNLLSFFLNKEAAPKMNSNTVYHNPSNGGTFDFGGNSTNFYQRLINNGPDSIKSIMSQNSAFQTSSPTSMTAPPSHNLKNMNMNLNMGLTNNEPMLAQYSSQHSTQHSTQQQQFSNRNSSNINSSNMLFPNLNTQNPLTSASNNSIASLLANVAGQSTYHNNIQNSLLNTLQNSLFAGAQTNANAQNTLQNSFQNSIFNSLLAPNPLSQQPQNSLFNTNSSNDLILSSLLSLPSLNPSGSNASNNNNNINNNNNNNNTNIQLQQLMRICNQLTNQNEQQSKRYSNGLIYHNNQNDPWK